MNYRNLFLGFSIALASIASAQGEQFAIHTPSLAIDPFEVRLDVKDAMPEEQQQAILRNQSEWADWSMNHPKWRSIMSPQTGLPHRAFGPAIEISGAGIAQKANSFVANDLALFGVEFQGEWTTQTTTGRHEWAFAQQSVDGIPVEGGQIVTKWWNDQLVMWGADWYRDVAMPDGEVLSEMAIQEAASAGVQLDEWSTPEMGTMRLVPLAGEQGLLDWRLVQTV
ncbi:MAG: hypothetical protein L7S62_04980, partial [Flavobacteriales bacterium]|nr:hypothetical protein [Flavobacteriales bacterium]